MMRSDSIPDRLVRGLALAPALLVAVLLAAPAAGQTSSPAPAGEREAAELAERLDSARIILAVHREAGGIPGLSAAVAVDGELLWSGGFGYANLQHRVPATADTRYRIASISKPVTAVAAMRLVEEGRLDLDTPIQRYVPDFPEKRGPITTRHLMSHTAGIRHYRGDEFMSDRRYADVFEPLGVFADDSLLFAPGTDYSYSTYGWTAVSAVVAGASGEPFLDYLDASVTGPLGLETLRPEHRDSIIPRHASFYIREDGRLINAHSVDLSNKWAGGGLVSTSADLVRFALGLLDGRLLRPETRAAMFTPQRLDDGEPVDYGLGWRMDAEQVQTAARTGDGRVIWHTGGAMGGSGVLLLRPDDGVVVSILANISGGGHLEPARRIAELFVREPAGTQDRAGARP